MSNWVIPFEQKVWGVSLIVGAVLLTLSTFFWQGSEYGVYGGMLVALASVCWIPGMVGLFGLLKERMPIYATLGLLVTIYGCVGGAFFGFEGMYTNMYNITQETARQGWSQYPLPANLTLFWPGLLFPLSLLVLSIVLGQTKTVPLWVALLLGLSALAFPLSRIPRIVWIAHVVDLLLLLAFVYLGILLWRCKQARSTA